MSEPKSENFQGEPRTIKGSLAWAVEFLRSRDVPEAQLSAEVLLSFRLGINRSSLVIHPDGGLDRPDWRAYKETIIRRSFHEPVAYLTGQKEFWSLDFQVNPGVLIPRPETELLVETARDLARSEPGGKTLVELGTGSGAVLVSLIKTLQEPGAWRCLATDISLRALETARKNARSHGVEKAISWVQGDWLFPFSSRRQWIDLLVSNPPYVSDAEMTRLPPTVKNFEPLTALEGGPDGLNGIRSILKQAVAHLKYGGWLLLEIGERQGGPVREIAEQLHFHPAEILRDYAGKDRVLKACYHG